MKKGRPADVPGANLEVEESEITNINVTPLVDVVLVLLIIFMVTTSKITNPEGMQVDKPDATTGAKIEPKSMVLVCHPDGRIVIDGKATADDEAVATAIADAVAKNGDVQGIVQCDENALVGNLVHLIDLLRKGGVKKYAIATEQPKPAGS